MAAPQHAGVAVGQPPPQLPAAPAGALATQSLHTSAVPRPAAPSSAAPSSAQCNQLPSAPACTQLSHPAAAPSYRLAAPAQLNNGDTVSSGLPTETLMQTMHTLQAMMQTMMQTTHSMQTMNQCHPVPPQDPLPLRRAQTHEIPAAADARPMDPSATPRGLADTRGPPRRDPEVAALARAALYTPLGCATCRAQETHIFPFKTQSSNRSEANSGGEGLPGLGRTPPPQPKGRTDVWVASLMEERPGQLPEELAASRPPAATLHRPTSPAASKILSVSSRTGTLPGKSF